MMRYFSPEYFSELATRLNADAEWNKKAATLTAKLVLTVTDREASFLLTIADGAVTASAVAADEPADFKFGAPYEVWTKVSRAELDFNTAVITGKMKFKGSLPKIMRIQSEVGRLVQVAAEIEAEL